MQHTVPQHEFIFVQYSNAVVDAEMAIQAL